MVTVMLPLHLLALNSLRFPRIPPCIPLVLVARFSIVPPVFPVGLLAVFTMSHKHNGSEDNTYLNTEACAELPSFWFHTYAILLQRLSNDVYAYSRAFSFGTSKKCLLVPELMLMCCELMCCAPSILCACTCA